MISIDLDKMAEHYAVPRDSRVFLTIIRAWRRALLVKGCEIGYAEAGPEAWGGFLEAPDSQRHAMAALLKGLDILTEEAIEDARDGGLL
jgi:hypothetical protein